MEEICKKYKLTHVDLFEKAGVGVRFALIKPQVC